MRRHAAWLCLGVSCTVLVTGCGVENADESGSRAAAERTVELWHIQTYAPTKPVVDAAVARTEAARPGLTIVSEAIKNDPFKTKLATAMGADSAPDVFHTWGGGVLATYAATGRVLELSSRDVGDLGRFHPAALSCCRSGGKLYALPVDVGLVPMWYNRELFKAAGVAPPATLEAFLQVCATFRAKGITPVALGNAQSWPGAFYFIYLATRAGGTEPIAQRRFRDPAFIEAGQWIQKLVRAGCFGEGFNGLGYDDARRAFFNGEAAMMLMGTWMLAHARKEAPEFLPRLGSFSFPSLGRRADWDATVVGGVNAAYAISSATHSVPDCLALLRELTGDTALKAWAGTGRIPALTREAAMRLFGEPPAVCSILFDAPQIQLYYDQLLPPALAAMHKETTQALFALTMTPAAAAAQMAATARQAP